MQTKQVIVIRKDLNMRRGKQIAQGSHASMAAILKLMSVSSDSDSTTRQLQLLKKDPINIWLSESFTKICVSCDSEEEILEIHRKAEKAGMLNALITDSGKTEFNNIPTVTALAIGPAESSWVDEFTGHLKLL